MLTSIQGPQAAEPREEDALDLLLGCHGRIRHFTDMALKLAHALEEPPEAVSSAAAAILRYYTIALPLHEADENESFYPRLHAALPAGQLADANEAMVEQHAGINAAVRALLPLWEQVQRHPETLAQHATALERLTGQLQDLWATHLALEEEQVVPAIRRYLSADELAAVRAEMHARRR
ncbi:MAG TPA: hemerythrin domain-containing protein [Terriglobales bacterium]|nr:hemerythrin domain-containing protein [Terriglobales bacterium]